METRILRGDEQQATFELFAQAFTHGSRDQTDFDNRLRDYKDDRTTVGVYDAQGIQAYVLVHAYQAHWGPNVMLPLGNIEGVATLPAVRGKGYAGAATKRALELMHETGQCVSMLNPFDFGFYRKYGWEWVGRRRKYNIATRSLKSYSETEHVRAVRCPSDRAAVVDVYTRFAARYRGMPKRNDRHWDRFLDDGKYTFTYTYLYEHDGEPQGYLTYSGGEQNATWIREFITLNAAAQRGLLGLLRRHEMQTDAFAWSAPEDDILWLQRMVNGIETKLWPMYMGRVVNVQAAFQAWHPIKPVSGAVTLAIADEYAPWNAGTWRVTTEVGQITAQPTAAAPQIELDIQAFSQAFFGTPTVAELRAAERLTIHDETGYAVLRDLLSGPPMYAY